jgi:hypothetical protein
VNPAATHIVKKNSVDYASLRVGILAEAHQPILQSPTGSTVGVSDVDETVCREVAVESEAQEPRLAHFDHVERDPRLWVEAATGHGADAAASLREEDPTVRSKVDSPDRG